MKSGLFSRLCPRRPSPQSGAPEAPLFDIRELRPDQRGRNEARIRALCNPVGLGPANGLARVLGRYKMYVDPHDFGLSPHLLLDGFWEMGTTEAIVECLRPGMVAVDVGANVGYFTMLMADLVGPQGRVLAFEPNHSMAERIRRSAYLNGMTHIITVHPSALAEKAQVVCFVIPGDEPKNAYIMPYEGGVVPPGAVLVETERLDARPERCDIEFLKIDAEGAEQQIWAGASGLRAYDKLRTIILEFQPGRYADAQGFVGDIMSWGFTLNWIHPDRGIQPLTVEQIMARNPKEDIMLVFRR